MGTTCRFESAAHRVSLFSKLSSEVVTGDNRKGRMTQKRISSELWRIHPIINELA